MKKRGNNWVGFGILPEYEKGEARSDAAQCAVTLSHQGEKLRRSKGPYSRDRFVHQGSGGSL